MLLLTGAAGLVGSAVRCLVRDPRRLGSERVRVQLAIGDLSDPASWRHALRGVKTVVLRHAPPPPAASGAAGPRPPAPDG